MFTFCKSKTIFNFDAIEVLGKEKLIIKAEAVTSHAR